MRTKEEYNNFETVGDVAVAWLRGDRDLVVEELKSNCWGLDSVVLMARLTDGMGIWDHPKFGTVEGSESIYQDFISMLNDNFFIKPFTDDE